MLLVVVCSVTTAIALDLSSQKYLAELAEKCSKAYFSPPDPKNVFTCIGSVDFDLQSDGSVLNVRVVKCPNYRNTKEPYIPSKKALEFAITSSSPFMNPPKTMHCPIKIRMNFDRNGKAIAVIKSDVNVGVSTGK